MTTLFFVFCMQVEIVHKTPYLTMDHGLCATMSRVTPTTDTEDSPAGLGLFLTMPVKKGDQITVYDGELVHRDALPRFQTEKVSV